MKYIIQCVVPYEHRVRVGIEAESRDAAIAKASELFDQSDIWQDTAEVPWLYDDFEEPADAGIPLEFTVEAEVAGDWPKPDASIKAIHHREAAFQAAYMLVEAYLRGEERDGASTGTIRTKPTGWHWKRRVQPILVRAEAGPSR